MCLASGASTVMPVQPGCMRCRRTAPPGPSCHPRSWRAATGAPVAPWAPSGTRVVCILGMQWSWTGALCWCTAHWTASWESAGERSRGRRPRTHPTRCSWSGRSSSSSRGSMPRCTIRRCTATRSRSRAPQETRWLAQSFATGDHRPSQAGGSTACTASPSPLASFTI